jgi:hypothetical protein
MMIKASLSLVGMLLVGGLLLTGCHREQHLRLVCVVDLSSSIEADARADAFAALREVFAQHRLHRGDTLIIVPVTNDSTTEAQGHVLRFEVSENRAAYDSDLKLLAVRVEKELTAIQAEAAAHPALHSDILGAVGLAQEELAKGPLGERKVIVVLSDLINDTPGINFTTAPQLANAEAAERYAASLADGRAGSLDGTAVALGLLRSSELKKVSDPRRQAITAFWTAYLKHSGAVSVTFATDGPSQLAQSVGGALRAGREVASLR